MDGMRMRTSLQLVTFNRPFRLDGMNHPEPAGDYLVRKVEQLPGLLTWQGWRAISLTIEGLRGGIRKALSIDAQQLREALVLDSGQATDPPGAPAVAAGQKRARAKERFRPF